VLILLVLVPELVPLVPILVLVLLVLMLLVPLSSDESIYLAESLFMRSSRYQQVQTDVDSSVKPAEESAAHAEQQKGE
jgi:hypothetical protein